ncbi:phoD [Plasmopara halstedii]|uniref:PhoD n=1 Tax=Plasmopara halstedii TaxID=4781 RepID=A0A0P1AXZ0_PLAHL|nr:phoD [Plasmopara halstedii]CEG45973.1 phoD [Plasmopara halstedii]|eukprot:XP_024582342.1 phoD [Plasmopara halstedii]
MQRKSTLVADLKQPLQRVAFGSCNDQSFPQPLWPHIAAHEPQLWIWMGDIIYADMKELDEPRPFAIPPRKMFVEAPAEVLIRKYNKLMANEDYAAFVSRTPVIGIWDDHDYGINDGGKFYSYREQSQQVFLDFIGEPKNSSRRQQQGIYTSYTIGLGEQTVKFILVDNRYNRDNYGTKSGDFLGEAQWKWLENELISSTAAFNVIVSGVQILPGDRYPIAECWDRFPNERERFFKLLLSSNAKGVILLSGDVHFSEINQVVCSNGTNTITEITSSGLTHSWMEFHMPSLKHIMALVFTYANLLLPWEFRPSQNSFYGHLNWGSIEFDWESRPHPVATVKIRGADEQVKLRYEFESKSFQSEAPEQDAGKCNAPRLIPRWQRFLWTSIFVSTVVVFLLLIPVNAFILLWLIWFFIKKTIFSKAGKKMVDETKKSV